MTSQFTRKTIGHTVPSAPSICLDQNKIRLTLITLSEVDPCARLLYYGISS